MLNNNNSDERTSERDGKKWFHFFSFIIVLLCIENAELCAYMPRTAHGSFSMLLIKPGLRRIDTQHTYSMDFFIFNFNSIESYAHTEYVICIHFQNSSSDTEILRRHSRTFTPDSLSAHKMMKAQYMFIVHMYSLCVQSQNLLKCF